MQKLGLLLFAWIELIKAGMFRYSRYRRERRSMLSRVASKGVKLTKNEKKEIEHLYNSYFKTDGVAHTFYKQVTGVFDAYYLPDYIYYCYVDPFYNDWTLAKKVDNKCYYPFLFSDVPQPLLLFRKQDGFWYDRDNKIITFEKVIDFFRTHSIEVFVKLAADSCQGAGVTCFNSETDSMDVLIQRIKLDNDYVIQEAVKQHEILSSINKSSVNTIRVLTFLRSCGEARVLSSCFRMGRNGSRVDNASAGGITVGITDNGHLKSVAYTKYGEPYTKHPDSGVKFKDILLPNYEQVIDLVKKQTVKFSRFRLISWDIAIDERGNPILIEANLCYGDLDFHQINNGPIFKDLMKEILEEVFEKK